MEEKIGMVSRRDLVWVRDTIKSVAEKEMCEGRKHGVLSNVVRFINDQILSEPNKEEKNHQTKEKQSMMCEHKRTKCSDYGYTCDIDPVQTVWYRECLDCGKVIRR